MPHARRIFSSLLVVTSFFLALAASPAAAAKPSAKVAIETTTIAAGVGTSWGEGTLTMNDGKKYTFTLGGVEAAAIGYSKVSATGEVFHLKKASDFAGTYLAIKAEAVVGSGPGTVTMRNEHGVIVVLRSSQKGVKLSFPAEAIQIAMK